MIDTETTLAGQTLDDMNFEGVYALRLVLPRVSVRAKESCSYIIRTK